MADVTLKIDADTAAYIAKIARMADAHEKVNKGLEKHADLADKFTSGLERALLKAVAVYQAVRSINDAYLQAEQRAAEMSKTTGQAETRLAGNLLELGFKGSEMMGGKAVFQQQGGLASQDEMNRFADNMATAQRARVGQYGDAGKFSRRQVLELSNAYRRGGTITYGEGGSDLLNAYKDPRQGFGFGAEARDIADDVARKRYSLPAGTRDPIGAGIASMDDNTLDEMSIRGVEKYNEASRRETLRQRGREARAAFSYKERAQDEVGALVNGFRTLSDTFTAGTSESVLHGLTKSQEEANVLEQRRVLRQDNPHDEGKP